VEDRLVLGERLQRPRVEPPLQRSQLSPGHVAAQLTPVDARVEQAEWTGVRQLEAAAQAQVERAPRDRKV
jgi:hypothetical protein